MKSGWEINEFKYAYGKSILLLLKARSLITNNEYEKCREDLVKQYLDLLIGDAKQAAEKFTSARQRFTSSWQALHE